MVYDSVTEAVQSHLAVSLHLGLITFLVWPLKLSLYLSQVSATHCPCRTRCAGSRYLYVSIISPLERM